MAGTPITLSDADACVDALIQKVGKDITLGLPLGLGKPVRLANALYRRACHDKTLNLHIVTAISMLAPSGSSSLERRFMKPFAERLYGDIPELAYAADVVKGLLPDNVQVSEFFFKAGSFLHHNSQQQNYVCTNYTHAVRDLLAQGVNVVAQMVSPPEEVGGDLFSLSCNPDLTLDLIPELNAMEREGHPIALIAETNRNLPYLGRDAEIPADTFDVVLDQPEQDYPLFSVPQMAISPTDHLIGFYASTLLRDGGTLQVGIGSLGAALVHSTIMRHRNNDAWHRTYQALNIEQSFPIASRCGGTGVFEEGLYGCSEMMVDGFIHLMKAGILKREVYDHVGLQLLINRGRISATVTLATLDVLREEEWIDSPLRARDVRWLKRYGILNDQVIFKGGRLTVGEYSLDPDLDDPEAREHLASLALGSHLTGGVVLHGGFYLGPESFYQALRDLAPIQKDRLCMTSVNFINHLYDHRFGDQKLKVAQRKDSRFINSAMMHTLNGAAVSDGLEDGRVVSGVGGQYNFVAMAHDLPGARSILTLRSTRQSDGKAVSNIVFSYGHCTIPRHLRDIVITEYGIADVRGKTDQEVYLGLIRIADSRFQQELLNRAQSAGKVASGFRLPAEWCQNTPELVQSALQAAGENAFPAFPFGCDFTEEELTLGKALRGLKAATATRRGKVATLWRALRTSTGDEVVQPLLERMSLTAPSGFKARLDRRLLVHGLRQSGHFTSSEDNAD
ncbi:MAG: acetyl-CoA hydrolase/transferase C-terminal domain-containing protein [Marinobacter sp.]|uniref:acetyl-CoA hydrolase/transferase C-terminal domain-containing protein n=1 Tax=Marinobacter sp. TaxID=50741 RepID=UPI00349FEA19